jgi:hypothetical protein
MRDFENMGRFITGVGRQGEALDVVSSDFDAAYVATPEGPVDGVSAPVSTGQYLKFQTPDRISSSPERAAGIRLRVHGGSADAVLRVVSFTQSTLDRFGISDANIEFIYPYTLGYDVPAGAKWSQTFALPADSLFYVFVESGDVAFVEGCWMSGV